MTPPRRRPSRQDRGVKSGPKRCWTGCLRLCAPCFPARNAKEPLTSLDKSQAAGHQEAHAAGYDKSQAADHQEAHAAGYEDKPLTSIDKSQTAGHQEEPAAGYREEPLLDPNGDLDRKFEQFMLKEQQLQPLSLKDLNSLLSLIMAQVQSYKQSRAESSVLVMQNLVSQYAEREEGITSIIQSLPSELTKAVVGGSKDVLMPLLTKTLGGTGNLHWVGLGLRLIAWTLNSVHDTMQNSEDCFEVLQAAANLMMKTKQIWEQACHNHDDTTNPDLQKIVEIAFRCAIICTCNMNNTAIVRFFDAQRVKETMTDLKQELRDAKLDALLYIAVEKPGAGSTLNRQISLANVNFNDKVGKDEETSLPMKFLRTDSDDIVALCIHGMGGIGKTFLGLEILKKFQGSKSLRLESPYETCIVKLDFGIKDKKLVDIQKQILHKLCGCDASNIYNCIEGREMLTKELKKMRDPAFLFMDNVLKDQHLVEILPKASCFPKGSKLLVTSRGTDIEIGIKGLGIENFKLIEIKTMKDEEAKELLWKQINNEERPKVGMNSGGPLEELEAEVLGLCGGLPLALEVVGGYIGSDERGPSNVRVWQDVVNAMKKAVPLSGEAHDALYSRIKFSIESLDANVRSAFLDIAAFYDTGTKWVLAGHLLIYRHHLRVLQQRGLVQKTQKSVGEPSLIVVHDVLLALARRMINDDTHELRITGTDSFIQLSGNLEKVVALKEVKLKASVLREMPLLRFLKAVTVEGECEEAAQFRHLSVVHRLSSKSGKLFNLQGCASLKYVSWESAIQNASDLEFLRHQKISDTLEVLDLWYWKQLKNVGIIETLRCLKGLGLHDCGEISSLPPGIGSLTDLKWLSLPGCRNLQTLPEGVASLTGLKTLSLRHCEGLLKLPERIGSLKRLTELSLMECSAIKHLPEGIGGLENLTVLDLGGCRRLECLQEGLQGLKSLTQLNMRGCKSLGFLPKSIAGMTSLVELNLRECSSLESLPEELACLPRLARLNLSRCSGLQNLQRVLAMLTSLTCLNLSECATLKSIDAVTTLTRLTEINLSDCEGLQMLPAGFSRLTSLSSLDLRGTRLDSGLHEIKSFTGLKSFTLSNCQGLYKLMEEGTFSVLGMVTGRIELSWGKCLPYLPESLTSFISLTELSFEGRGVTLPLLPQELTSLTGLKALTITKCASIRSLSPGFMSLRSLERLKWEDCRSLQSLEEIAGLTGLEVLKLAGCASRNHSMLKEIWTLTGLTELRLGGWENVRGLPDGLASLTRLRELDFRRCTSLLSLPEEMGRLTSLLSVNLKGCKTLKCLPHGLLSLSNLRLCLQQCTSLVEMDATLMEGGDGSRAWIEVSHLVANHPNLFQVEKAP